MKHDGSSDFVLDTARTSPGRRIEGSAGHETFRSLLIKLQYRLLKLITVLVMPFFVLVGSSAFFYRRYGFPTWLALITGVFLTVLLLLLYASWVAKKLTGNRKVSRTAMKAIVLVVASYCIYALIYLSSLNAKSDEVRGYYRSLHPLLRLAVSTLILADEQVVITDARRQPDDYMKMGLVLRARSLHFEQQDRYVHALDLRTVGRDEWKNRLMQAYFWVMGFRTKRHVGTEDHLHISLPVPY